MSPKNKIKLNKLRKKLDKIDIKLLKIIKESSLLSSLSNFFLSKFSFILFFGDIYSIGFTYN